MEREIERQLVINARNGDVEALGKLYEHYYATMVWLAYSILLNRDLAEDMAQQTFVRACEKLVNLRHVDRFGPWLSRICRNEAHQCLRQQNQLIFKPGSEVDGKFELTPDQDDLHQVKIAINRLGRMYREVVVLHYYNHMSYQQMAKILGIAVHTVRGRLFRARKQIEKYLKQQGIAEGYRYEASTEQRLA